MKKMMFFVMMVMAMVVNASAQEIISMGCGEIVLQGGIVIDASRIPNAHMLRLGEDINYGIQRVNMLVAQRRRMEAMKAAYTDMYTMAANAAAYGGACYGGGVVAPVAVGGYESSGFSIGNEHWGFSTNSSKCGAYESGSMNVRVGGFQIGTYNSGVSKAAKKAAAQQATARYSMKKNNVAASGNTRSASSNKKVVREVNLLDAGL